MYLLNQVLSDISASFDVGELIAVTGRNGSGKTTLTRLLVGLEQPSNGMIFYKNKNPPKIEFLKIYRNTKIYDCKNQNTDALSAK